MQTERTIISWQKLLKMENQISPGLRNVESRTSTSREDRHTGKKNTEYKSRKKYKRKREVTETVSSCFTIEDGITKTE
jgi:hypothetical protein